MFSRGKASGELAMEQVWELGLPSGLSAVAYDPVQKLVAVATDHGRLFVLGQPGVFVQWEDPDGCEIRGLAILVNQGRVIAMCPPHTLKLWSFQSETPELTHKLQFKRETLTTVHLPPASPWIYVGTQRGNVFVVCADEFVRSQYTITWDKLIPRSRKDHPGAVVKILEHPTDPGKLLVVQEHGAALWDLRERKAEHTYSLANKAAAQSACWGKGGSHFLIGFANGSLSRWNVKDDSGPDKTIVESSISVCDGISAVCHVDGPHGPTVVHDNEDHESTDPLLVFRRKDEVCCGLLESAMCDLAPVFKSPWAQDQTAEHVLVLTAACLYVVELTSPACQRVRYMPHGLELRSSLVTSTAVCTVCPHELMVALRWAGRRHASSLGLARVWPIEGGSMPRRLSRDHTLVLTGHRDGSIKFWDSSEGRQRPELLYVLELPRCSGGSMFQSQQGRMVQHIQFCPESRHLLVGYSGGLALHFAFAVRSDEVHASIHPVVFEVVDDKPSDKAAATQHDSVVPGAMETLIGYGFSREDAAAAFAEADEDLNLAAAILFERDMARLAAGVDDPAPAEASPAATAAAAAAERPVVESVTYSSLPGFQLQGGSRAWDAVDGKPQRVLDHVSCLVLDAAIGAYAVGNSSGVYWASLAEDDTASPVLGSISYCRAQAVVDGRPDKLQNVQEGAASIQLVKAAQGIRVLVGTTDGNLYDIRQPVPAAAPDVSCMLTCSTQIVGICQLTKAFAPVTPKVAAWLDPGEEEARRSSDAMLDFKNRLMALGSPDEIHAMRGTLAEGQALHTTLPTEHRDALLHLVELRLQQVSAGGDADRATPGDKTAEAPSTPTSPPTMPSSGDAAASTVDELAFVVVGSGEQVSLVEVASKRVKSKATLAAALSKVSLAVIQGKPYVCCLTNDGDVSLLTARSLNKACTTPLGITRGYRSLRTVAFGQAGEVYAMHRHTGRMWRASVPEGAAAAAQAADAGHACDAASSASRTRVFNVELAFPPKPADSLGRSLANLFGSAMTRTERDQLLAERMDTKEAHVTREELREAPDVEKSASGYNALKVQMNERTEKLRRAEEKAEQMKDDAADFAAGANALLDRYQNRKWWQF